MLGLDLSGAAMRYIKVTVLHQPDAGQSSTSHFTYPVSLGRSDEDTAGEFAFQALGGQDYQKGFIRVAFPQTAAYYFRFERAGIMGYNLTRTQGQPQQALFT